MTMVSPGMITVDNSLDFDAYVDARDIPGTFTTGADTWDHYVDARDIPISSGELDSLKLTVESLPFEHMVEEDGYGWQAKVVRTNYDQLAEEMGELTMVSPSMITVDNSLDFDTYVDARDIPGTFKTGADTWDHYLDARDISGASISDELAWDVYADARNVYPR